MIPNDCCGICAKCKNVNCPERCYGICEECKDIYCPARLDTHGKEPEEERCCTK
ncbi:hypothetical protein McpCs1_14820 [Methanocorpusculaceae archaeon Cs1]|uniref:4Fe-4S ferredoxin-type domain-containing protein n=1 Tax=Methanorbis rubei TaxID=3028300 RepID=A0AAE4MH08_9EURY|nr:hypothetical protein [Methanocorpusculaceae archaeon Cs1]